MLPGLKTNAFFFILTAVLNFGALFSQEIDSTSQAELDSMLDKQQNILVSKNDSLNKIDSLERLKIEEQLSESTDTELKRTLQLKLDSLTQLQLNKQSLFRERIDSLRASVNGVPVTFFDDTLFSIYAKIGPFKPSYRAKNITKQLETLVNENKYSPESIKVVDEFESSDILHGDQIILSVTEADAMWQNTTVKELANSYSEIIKTSIKAYDERTGGIAMLKRIGLLCLVLLIFYLAIKFMNRGFTKLNNKLVQKSGFIVKKMKFKNYEFITEETEIKVVRFILRTIKWILILIILYLSLPIMFSIFPSTKGIATTLMEYITSPVKQFGAAIIGFIPEMITITVIVLITRGFIRFLRSLSVEVERGKLQIPGFYSDWARPTFNLLKIIIYAFSFIVIFPYLPGSDSPVFQGVSVFLGLLISLGSSSAIGNIIAGLVITYMRAFKIGDRVKIGDVTGDVIEKTMLVTRVRTIKNEDVAIPNSAIMNGSTINYTSSSEELGLILHSTVTIGYDVPWRKVHDLLLSAADKTNGVSDDPKPFVLQTSLDDFYVSYQINAYTKEAGSAAKLYSEMHGHIQDAFNEAGIEILSPHYRAARDGNQVTLPEEYLPEDYEAPSFNVKTKK